MTLPIRLGRPGDMAFVIDSWTKSYEGAAQFKGCDYEHYKAEMTKAIRRICDRAELRVAYDPQDEDHLVGYACFTGGELHYLYVKRDYRQDVKPADLLRDVRISAYSFRGRHMQDALVGHLGCHYEMKDKDNVWRPPQGWRYLPRITF